MITEADKRAAESYVRDNPSTEVDEDARAANRRLLRHAKPHQQKLPSNGSLPAAQHKGAEPSASASLQPSCNAFAPALQPISISERLLIVIKTLSSVHEAVREELLEIIAAIDASHSVTDEAHLRDALIQITAHCAALDTFIMDAQLEIRFRRGRAAQSLRNL